MAHAPVDAHTHSGGRTAALALGALGIVYGDIGTSPLYAMRETFEGAGHEISVSSDHVLGVLSLIFWALILVITVKYLLFVMRADNQGEGGILALASLITPTTGNGSRSRWILVLVGIFGTALLYGDGMITPAISVLSAVEGVEVAASGLEDWVVPISVLILVGLFAVQKRGTATLGSLFGPIMVTWFVTLGVLGAVHVADDPGVFRALNPWYAIRFFPDAGYHGFLALGSVFLVVTGGEALYADMGHFGRRPIQFGWFSIVLPALLLNYFGQGAMLLAEPEHIDNPFYRLAPDWGVVPLVVLATAATVIASQALISGVYSLTMQAVQLSYSPRVQITHTSATAVGQIYIPAINWGLMAACIGLVLGFRSSTALAAAYGVAVTTTMVITTLLLYVVLRERFGWSRVPAVVLCSAFMVMDLGFFVANLFKIPDGGWFPLVVGAVVFTLMTTWRTGRRLVGERLRGRRLPLATYLEGLMRDDPPTRVPGVAVYLFSMSGLTPPALLANVRHNKVMHEQVVVVGVVTDESPRVLPARRTKVVDVGHGVKQVELRYGFMEEPDVPCGLTQGVANKLRLNPDTATYVLGSESLVVTDRPGMMKWRERLFTLMSRNATSAANYFCLPPEQIMTVGVLVEL